MGKRTARAGRPAVFPRRRTTEPSVVHVRAEEKIVSRRHADPVEVVRRDTEPEQFLWRDRLYLVREVLAHWTETAAWWEGALARVSGGAAVEQEREQEFWRVEAGSGRVAAAQAGTGVYDLCFDWSQGRWSLSRVVD